MKLAFRFRLPMLFVAALIAVAVPVAHASTVPRRVVPVGLDSIDGMHVGDVMDRGIWLIKADRSIDQGGGARLLTWGAGAHEWAADHKMMDGSNDYLSFTGRFRLPTGDMSGESLAAFLEHYPHARVVRATHDHGLDCAAPEYNALVTSTGTYTTTGGKGTGPVTTVFSFTAAKRLRSVEMSQGRNSVSATDIFDEPCGG